jgi:hypothetical protein
MATASGLGCALLHSLDLTVGETKTDFHRALSHLPSPAFGDAPTAFGTLLFGRPALGSLPGRLSARTLRDLVTPVTADSDLTKPPIAHADDRSPYGRR